MKKFPSSTKRKFGFARLLSITAVVLTAAIFINALPNLTAQAANSDSFFGLANLFSWNSTPTTTPAAEEPIINSPLDTVTVCNTGTPTFATLAAAVADANTAVPAGGRTYEVCAGHTETAPAGGYALTAASSAADPIVFQKSGAGANPLITSYTGGTGTPGTAVQDGIFRIVGSDFVTIDGIDLVENSANTTNPSTMEYGYGLFKASATDGAQNNTIRNCVITLNRINNASGSGPAVDGSRGISVVNSLATTQTTAITVTSAAGTNSNNKFYTNTIQNVNIGIALIGFAAASPFTLADTNNDIGGVATETGNQILNFGGGASATNPAAGVRTLAQYGLNVSYNTVNNNNGAGVNHPSTLRGIFLNTATSASENITNNIVTLKGGGTTSALIAIDNAAGSTAASNTIAITNNTVQNSTYATATSGSFTAISNTGSAATVNISGNTIQNNTLGVTATGTIGTFIGITGGSATNLTVNNNIINNNTKNGTSGVLYGIQVGTAVLTVSGNTITNLAVNGTVATTSAITLRGIYDVASATSETYSNNIINNLTSSNNSSSVGSIISGIETNTISSSTITIAGNTVNSLSFTSSNASGGATVNGLRTVSGGTINVSKNKIYDLTSNGASSAAFGLNHSIGNPLTISNNLIGDIKTPSANAANPLAGISITGGITSNVYFNTVYLTGTSTGALFGSSAISTSTTPALTLRNNIFVNNTTPTGAGLAAAYRRSSTSLTAYQSASNNNDFFAPAIFTDGTNTSTTIGAYKTFVSPRDANSISENPAFLSTSGSSANFLHIDPAVPTQLESGGTAVSGITDDFDGNTRNATTPDIGADEFNGVGLDLTAPSISYTPLANTASTADRNLTVTITDPSGVAGGGLAPRIYYRKNGGAYSSSQCTGSSPTYTCTIVVSNLGGVVVTDLVEYFVVAQDVNGNLGSSPSGASGTDVNNITGFPAAPSSYTILGTISGDKTVGVGGDYLTLTAAAAAINGNEISGPVTLTLTEPLYDTASGEVFPINFNANSGSSSTNTVTIKPASIATPSITGSSATCVINLNGIDFMTIDGSSAPSGTSRDLTITNTSTATSSGVVCLTSTGVGAGATNDTVKNTNIVGNSNTTTLVGIHSGGSTVGTPGADNDSNTIQNNNISKTAFGIYSFGASAANKNTGTVVTQNLVNTVAPNNVARGGIMVGFEDTLQLTENNVSGIAQTSSPDVFGISLGLLGLSTSTFTGSEVTNAVVSKNIVGSVRNTGTFSACGICVAPATSGTNQISNNMISGVSANGTSGDISVGIFIGGGTGSTTQIYYNSISMSGTQTGGSDKSYALAVGGNDPIVDIRNNILANTQNNGTGNNYAIVFGYSTFANLTSDFNDFFVTSPSTTHFVGGTGSISAPVNQATLANLQTATGKDSTSVSGDPGFVSATDLHINAALGMVVSNKGTPIAGITTDIDNETRNATTPDIGADEFAPPVGAGTVEFGSATFNGNEGTIATITVNRVGGSGGAVSVNYATSDGTATAGSCGMAGADYQSASGTLNWADSEAGSKTFDVTLCTDSIFPEGSETVLLTLSNPVGTTITDTNPATLTINDVSPPSMQFSTATYSAGEGSNGTITVTRTGDTTGASSVDYATVAGGTATGGASCGAGIDYVTTTGTLNFAAGQTSLTFTVQLCGDIAEDPSETINLELSNPMGGTLGTQSTAILTISDAASQFCNSDGVITIPPTSATPPFPSTPYPSNTVVSGLTGSVDNVRVTLNTFQHTWSDDVDILLVSPTGQTMILMSDAGGSVGLDTAKTLTFSATGPVLPDGATFASGTYKPTNYEAANDVFATGAPAGPYGDPGPGGTPAGTATLDTVFDGINPNGTWQLFVSDDANGDGGTIQSWCLEITTIAPSPGTLQFSSATYATNENTTATITVNRSGGGAGTVTADVAINGSSTATGGAACTTGVDYINTGFPQTLTFVDGDNSQSFNVTVCPDAVTDPTETIIFDLTNPTGGAVIGAINQATLTINDVPPPLSGNYTVPGNFPSLTNPGGIFEALNLSGASGTVNINITANLIDETGSIGLNPINGSEAVTIRPTGGSWTISSTPTATRLIPILGADNVTIEGNDQTTPGVDRGLTFNLMNTTAGSESVVIFVASQGVGAGATNFTLQNSTIQAGGNGSDGTLTTLGVYVGGLTGSSGPDNDNLRIQNNLIQRATIGIQAIGTAAGVNNNTVIVDNTFGGAAAADFLGQVGINVGQADNARVTRNIVNNIVSSDTVDVRGIILGAGTLNSSVTRNRITNLNSTNTGGYGSVGIFVGTNTAASGITVANNFISDIKGTTYIPSIPADTVAGIMIAGATGGVNIYYNSVNLFGDYAGFNGATITGALSIVTATVTDLNIRDNIFVNSFNNTTVTTDRNFAIYSVPANTAFTDINYNDYFVSGPQGVLGSINGVDVTTLAELQTATGKDLNSVSADPLFVSPTDLHILNPASPVSNVGTPIAGITVDFDSQSRSATTPDIGADEFIFSPTAASVEIGGRVREANGRGIFRTRVTMTDAGGDIRMAFTNQFGYFRFSNVAAGNTYVFSATDRRYQFVEPTQVQFISEATEGINFTASGSNPEFRPEATFFDNAPFDFDGDGRTDVSVFRNSDNTWYINRSSDNTLFAQAFGAAGDRLAPADFDGDGKTDIAVFRSSEGNWYVWLSASNSLRVEQFGTELDRAIPADFDGDGKADFSIWNEMRGTWQVKLSTNGTIVTERFNNGKGDFTPLATDRDGDGKADFIFFNNLNATWTIRTSAGANVKEQFGAAGDRAATGDFDGDGQGDLAVYRANGNVWTIKLATGKELTDLRLSANANNPALGDFDGDGKADAAGFGAGVWSVRQSVNGAVRQQQFGLADDTVIPSVR